MAELSEQFWRWIAKLLPKQQNQGAGVVQVGKAGGDIDVVTNVSHTVNHVNTSHVTIVVSAVEPVAAAAPAIAPAPRATAEQREVLRMMRGLANEEAVFIFMQREFRTRMVIDLQPSELLRVRRYVETILRRTQKSTSDLKNADY